jgi:hypothetical protein
VVDLNWASHPVGHVGVHLAVVDDQGHLIEAKAEGPDRKTCHNLTRSLTKRGLGHASGGSGVSRVVENGRGLGPVSAKEWRIFCIKLHACQ